jgi:hypothetical protein
MELSVDEGGEDYLPGAELGIESVEECMVGSFL